MSELHPDAERMIRGAGALQKALDDMGAGRPQPTDDTCRVYEVDGEPIRVHGAEPMSEEGQAALSELVHATQRMMAAEHPNLGIIQELIAAGMRAMRCIPDGEIRTRFGTTADGTVVKARLKAAIAAARGALTPEETSL